MDVYAPVIYAHEYDERIPVALIGCTDHVYRNVLPALGYTPAEIVAVADPDPGRAQSFRRITGAKREFTDYRKLLDEVRPTAVCVAMGYDGAGLPLEPPVVAAALERGCHVWVEKPLAASVDVVDRLRSLSIKAGRFVLVGIRRMFSPSILKAAELIESGELGDVTSIYVRYPESLPPVGERSTRSVRAFLDHYVHPFGALLRLVGPVESLHVEREARRGGAVLSLRFVSGAVGSVHLTAGQSAASPLERLEIVGDGANLVIDNNTRIAFYRRSAKAAYGRKGVYYSPGADEGPIIWEPEFSLSQVYNQHVFLQGYVHSLLYFFECVKTSAPPATAGLDDLRHLVTVYQAILDAQGTVLISA